MHMHTRLYGCLYFITYVMNILGRQENVAKKPQVNSQPMEDGTVMPYFCKYNAEFAALHKIVVDEWRLKALKFYICSR